eukprot:TRINITY_DN61125_c0_g1_i1.p1 TRINITY_DN61125_c0_g1~~TRINITY_DN61125_c0_g1_i1.p1  ORF type:complete len:1003 (-),score=182.35 TRINITY_DN61125_c0_g1_i1:44-2947(-)
MAKALLEPVTDGIRLGGLVQVHSLSANDLQAYTEDINGSFGQVVGISETGKYHVYLTCGAAGHFDPKNVAVAEAPRRPGESGGAESFDLLIGPRTDGDVLGGEIATCLMEKGFCVLRICQSARLAETAQKRMQDLVSGNQLSRFPEEVEQGYLGFSCRGRVAWMDGANGLQQDEGLASNDSNLSYLAQAIQPFSGDVLEGLIDSRTAGLACLTMDAEGDANFPCPEADDESLGQFLQTWRRGLARAVHFMGPLPAVVELDARETKAAGKVPKLADTVQIRAVPNTILLFRPDVYDYTCAAPKDTLMLIANYLAAVPELVLGEIEGDTDWLVKSDGPPPPVGEQHVHVVNTVARLPGNWDSSAAYWQGLKAGNDTIVQVPISRWDVNIYWTADENEFHSWQSTTRHQSYCEGAEMFDNRYFEISTAEAGGMDPVQRLVLECGAQSLAQVGLTKKEANRKSTHAGFCVGNDKLDWMTCDKPEVSSSMGGTSTVLAIIANRFSFVFNLKGPNFVCDTACSASLTSTHCARFMISNQKYDPLEFFVSMGAHLCLSPGPFIGCSQAHMSSPKGRCFTFNSSADGYLRGEGISGFMMKYGAISPEESIGILRATACGQDGRSASLTAPNGPAQEEMVTRCMKEALMIPPESTAWECHGTGTSLGDPIEVGAVRKTQVRMQRTEPLMIGSVKTNMGHLEGGAAMGGIVKCVLQCRNAKCAPTQHLRTLNPHLEHTKFDAVFETEPAAFATNQGNSQVSSFGFGGTNAHGVFWGQNYIINESVERLWMKKLLSRPPPEVRPMGQNYDEWEADFPDTRMMRKGVKFSVSMGPDETHEPLRWDIVGTADQELDEMEATFAIVGNFNNWDVDEALPMEDAEVPGVHRITLQVPPGGLLEFHLLKGGSSQAVVGPNVDDCTQKGAPIIGPDAKLSNKWAVHAPEGKEVRIEFFNRSGRRSILWIVERERHQLVQGGDEE